MSQPPDGGESTGASRPPSRLGWSPGAALRIPATTVGKTLRRRGAVAAEPVRVGSRPRTSTLTTSPGQRAHRVGRERFPARRSCGARGARPRVIMTSLSWIRAVVRLSAFLRRSRHERLPRSRVLLVLHFAKPADEALAQRTDVDP